MKRRSFLALPFVAAIAGVAKLCCGQQRPAASGIDDAMALHREYEEASTALVDVTAICDVEAGRTVYWDSVTRACMFVTHDRPMHVFYCDEQPLLAKHLLTQT